MPKNVTLIMPYYNAEDHIQRLFPTLLDLERVHNWDIIIVDDCSNSSPPINSESHNFRIISTTCNQGPAAARNLGLSISRTNINIFMDTDVFTSVTELLKAAQRFDDDDALAFSCQHHHQSPHRNFCSHYKAAYMNYTLSKAPKPITFIYGSLCGLKKNSDFTWPTFLRYGEDTYLATSIINQGHKVSFYEDIVFTHFKHYDLSSLLKNDFTIPYYFTYAFYKTRHKKTFSHVNKNQLAAIAMIPLLPMTWPLWFLFNWHFFTYMKHKGFNMFLVVVLTLLDQFFMGLGIFCGLISHIIPKRSINIARQVVEKKSLGSTR